MRKANILVIALASTLAIVFGAFAIWATSYSLDGTPDGESLSSRLFAPSFQIPIFNNTAQTLHWKCETGGFTTLLPGNTGALRFLKHDPSNEVSQVCSTSKGQDSGICIYDGYLHAGERFTATEFEKKFSCV